MSEQEAAYIFKYSLECRFQAVKLPRVTNAVANGPVGQALKENGGETRDSLRLFEAPAVPVTVIQEYLPDYRPRPKNAATQDIGTKWMRLMLQSYLQHELRDVYLKSLGIEGWMVAASDLGAVRDKLEGARELMRTLLRLLRDERVYNRAKNVYELRIRNIFGAAELSPEEVEWHIHMFPDIESLYEGRHFGIHNSIPRGLSAGDVALRETAIAGYLNPESQDAVRALIASGVSGLQGAVAQATEAMKQELLSLVAEQLDKMETIDGKRLTHAARKKLNEQSQRVECLLNMLDAVGDSSLSEMGNTVAGVVGQLKQNDIIDMSERLQCLRAGHIEKAVKVNMAPEGHWATGQHAMI